MSVVKVVEVKSSSSKSWKYAAQYILTKASKTLNNIASICLQDQSCAEKDGQI